MLVLSRGTLMETQVNVEEGGGLAHTAVPDVIRFKNGSESEASIGGKYFNQLGIFAPAGMRQAKFPITVNREWIHFSQLTEETQRLVAIWLYNLYDLNEGIEIDDFERDFPDIAAIYFQNK